MIIKITTTDGHKKNILSLLDTRAIRKICTFIKCDALTLVLHSIECIGRKLQGQYVTEMAKEVATFEIKLPELC
eukprot:10934649-Ditylum_brightwellii.AAC.1